MKLLSALIVSLFTLSAFAAEPAKKEEKVATAPAAVKPSEAKPVPKVDATKSQPVKKDATKAETKAAK